MIDEMEVYPYLNLSVDFLLLNYYVAQSTFLFLFIIYSHIYLSQNSPCYQVSNVCHRFSSTGSPQIYLSRVPRTRISAYFVALYLENTYKL